jgi:hypothetical protein
VVSAEPHEIAPAAVARPFWRRARLWVALAVVTVVGGVLVGSLADEPGRPYDPGSPAKNGSLALHRLLARYGVGLTSTDSVERALTLGRSRAVVVVAPDDYASAQLRRLAEGAGRLVLARPGTRAVHAVDPTLEPDASAEPGGLPGCPDATALATGAVSLPGDAIAYRRAGEPAGCYAGALVSSPRLAVLGSADVLRNDHLADEGAAAFDINAITDGRRLRSVVWLLPGGDAAGPGPASVWDLFPAGAYRVFWWAVVVGALLALWRARRLGSVVTEPLPVVVRSAELVEGHGRLYARDGARERAAGALRAAAVTRLAARLGLPRGAPADQVAVAAAPLLGRAPSEIVSVLAGPAPTDDAGLQHLARELDRVESALGGPDEGTHG